MDFKEELKKKYNYAIAIGVGTFVGAIIIFFAAILPLYNNSAKITQEASEKSTQLTQLNQKKDALDRLNDKQEELKASAEKVSAALPEGKDVGRLFIQINQLAIDSGASIKSISVGGSAGGSTPTTNGEETGFTGIQKYSISVPISFKNYFDLKKFISSSQNALRLLSIDTISISAANSSPVGANLTITTFARN